VVVVD